MQNQKQIKLIISCLVVLGILIGGYFLYKNKRQTLPPASNPDTVLAVPSDAWNVFEQYLGYLKNHDIEKLKTVEAPSLVERHPDCPMRQVATGLDCNALMDMAYKEGNTLNRADFVNTWEDAKQVILSTNVGKKDSTRPNSENYGIYYIFFTKDQAGHPKVLNFSGVVTTFLYPDISKVPAKQKLDAVAKDFMDADQDGLLDKNENCTRKDTIPSPYNYDCSTTSAKKRDSLGDGWWDGVRVFLSDPVAKK